MKLLIRHFFKIVHVIAGPVLLALDRLTRPRPVERDPEEQLRVDAETRQLALYQFLTCPFCIRTRRAIRRLSLNIETRDALGHAASRQELLQGGGRIRVPCLRITDAQGGVMWLYESADIISYLQDRFPAGDDSGRSA